MNIQITSNNTKHTCSTVHNGGKIVEFSLKTVDPNDICLVPKVNNKKGATTKPYADSNKIRINKKIKNKKIDM
jgi:hypothetical protein